MAIYTNKTKRQKAIRTGKGLVFVPAGKSVKLDERFTAEYLARLQSIGIDVSDETPPQLQSSQDDRPSVEDLKARAIALGIDVKGTWGVPKLTEEIARAEAAGQT